MNKEKSKLYRKVNTTAFAVKHNFGGDYKTIRNSKRESLQALGKMSGKKARGLDYTPLYRFLISKVGANWADVFSEAKARLDQTDPIFHLVALQQADRKDLVRTDESAYFSGLFIDDNEILQLSNPNLKAKDMTPSCNCCTHTFNGKLFGSE